MSNKNASDCTAYSHSDSVICPHVHDAQNLYKTVTCEAPKTLNLRVYPVPFRSWLVASIRSPRDMQNTTNDNSRATTGTKTRMF